MCDAMVGVLAGVVLMALVLMGWQAAKALWAGEWGQVVAVVGLMVVPFLVVAYPVVFGLLLLLVLCMGGFLFFVDRASRETSFFGTWMCFDLAGDCLKAAGFVLVALVQAVVDSKKG